MKRKVITILSILCIIVLFIAAAAGVHLSHTISENPPGTVGNTAGNLYNGGLFCEDKNDGCVYFSNPYDGGALYRMSPDETDMEKLVTTQVQRINSAVKYL